MLDDTTDCCWQILVEIRKLCDNVMNMIICHSYSEWNSFLVLILPAKTEFFRIPLPSDTKKNWAIGDLKIFSWCNVIQQISLIAWVLIQVVLQRFCPIFHKINRFHCLLDSIISVFPYTCSFILENCRCALIDLALKTSNLTHLRIANRDNKT